MIKIDKNVPIKDKSFGGRVPKYPFSQMEIGDSFVAGDYSYKLQNSVGNSALVYNKRYGLGKFISRKVSENGKDVLRVWRIA